MSQDKGGTPEPVLSRADRLRLARAKQTSDEPEMLDKFEQALREEQKKRDRALELSAERRRKNNEQMLREAKTVKWRDVY